MLECWNGAFGYYFEWAGRVCCMHAGSGKGEGHSLQQGSGEGDGHSLQQRAGEWALVLALASPNREGHGSGISYCHKKSSACYFPTSAGTLPYSCFSRLWDLCHLVLLVFVILFTTWLLVPGFQSPVYFAQQSPILSRSSTTPLSVWRGIPNTLCKWGQSSDTWNAQSTCKGTSQIPSFFAQITKVYHFVHNSPEALKLGDRDPTDHDPSAFITRELEEHIRTPRLARAL